jgi:DNA-binding XRE family transcriptional regulator
MDQTLTLDKTTNSNDSPESRALRLKRVRNLANLTRDQMCEDGEIKRNTLIGWENGRFGGLTANGAAKVLARVTREGVHCSVDWLMYGAGSEPSVNPLPAPSEGNHQVELNEDTAIAYELALFNAKNLNAVDMVVDDDGMLPQYKETDIVAGKKRTGKDIQSIIGRDCIVQTEDDEVLFRNVREGKDSELYTLVCNNPTAKKKNSIVVNVKLIYAAPVIWHRRKDT